jgi:SPX domain protein involved in polyphosphate accumulation
MKFGTTLRKSVYAPWKGNYIDYEKLKKLLKDNEEDDSTWTNDDEEAFVNELANVQLEKVDGFVKEISQKLRDRTSACEKKLEPLAAGVLPEDGDKGKGGPQAGEGLYAQAGDAPTKPELSQQEREKLLKEVLRELDSITRETKELESFSRLNFTAVIKATKKHDKIRGGAYKLRAFIDARLARHPLHTEDASPLLYRLSALYSFVRQSLEGKPKEALSFVEGSTASEGFVSHKCTSPSAKVYIMLTHARLGSHGQSLRSQDRHPPPLARPRLQPAVVQGRRRHPARPHHHLDILRQPELLAVH